MLCTFVCIRHVNFHCVLVYAVHLVFCACHYNKFLCLNGGICQITCLNTNIWPALHQTPSQTSRCPITGRRVRSRWRDTFPRCRAALPKPRRAGPASTLRTRKVRPHIRLVHSEIHTRLEAPSILTSVFCFPLYRPSSRDHVLPTKE